MKNRFIVKGNINDVCNKLNTVFEQCKNLGVFTVGQLFEMLNKKNKKYNQGE